MVHVPLKSDAVAGLELATGRIQLGFQTLSSALPLARGRKIRILAHTHADLWAYHHKVRIDFSRPGKPTDNCYVETFNGSLRDECLNVHWFESLGQAREIIEAWRHDYNESRPHMALADVAPREYARQARLSAC